MAQSDNITYWINKLFLGLFLIFLLTFSIIRVTIGLTLICGITYALRYCTAALRAN